MRAYLGDESDLLAHTGTQWAGKRRVKVADRADAPGRKTDGAGVAAVGVADALLLSTSKSKHKIYAMIWMC